MITNDMPCSWNCLVGLLLMQGWLLQYHSSSHGVLKKFFLLLWFLVCGFLGCYIHRAVKLCEQALVSVDPAISTLGTMQEVCLGQPFSSHSDLYIIYWSVCHIHLYQAHVFRSPSGCAAFLANYNSNSYAKVVFNNEQYNLPPWSISILPDCKNVVFNSATVSFTCAYFQYGTFSSSCISPLLFPRTVWWPGLPDCNCLPLQVGVQTSQMQMWGDGASSMMWERYDEEVDSLAAAPLLTTTGLLEQLNVTRDSSDYLWYITR